MKAAAQGQLPRLQYLVRLGVDIDHTDDQGYTALHHAVLSGFEDCVQELINLGADVNAFTSFDETPLNLAAHKQRHNVVRILLVARADAQQAINREDAQEWERQFLLSCMGMATSNPGGERTYQFSSLSNNERRRAPTRSDINAWLQSDGLRDYKSRPRNDPSAPLASYPRDGITNPDSYAQPQSNLPFARHGVYAGRDSDSILDRNQGLPDAGVAHTWNGQHWRHDPVEPRGRQLDRKLASPWAASSGDTPHTPNNQLPSHLETVSSGAIPYPSSNQLLSYLEKVHSEAIPYLYNNQLHSRPGIMYRPGGRSRSVCSDIDVSVDVSPPPSNRTNIDDINENPASPLRFSKWMMRCSNDKERP